jgi:hypothetical protein
MTRRLINSIALIASFGLTMLIVPALCYSATWENLDRFGETRMVTIENHVDRIDFDDIVNFIPINGYGFASTDRRTVMVFEAKSQVDWPTIKAWVNLLEE